MQTLLIAYDLASAAETAPALTAAIMSLGTRWARPLTSLWYVETEKSATAIEAGLMPLLGDDDGLLVQPALGTAALANTVLRWTPARTTGATEVPAIADGAEIILWPRRGAERAAAA